jgi:hypothetical protein
MSTSSKTIQRISIKSDTGCQHWNIDRFPLLSTLVQNNPCFPHTEVPLFCTCTFRTFDMQWWVINLRIFPDSGWCIPPIIGTQYSCPAHPFPPCFSSTSLSNFHPKHFSVFIFNLPIIMAVPRTKAWTVFARPKAGIMGSNSTQGMDVCLRLFCVCVGSGLATSWSPFQGVLPTVLGLRNWSETKRFTDALCSKVGTTGERERDL